MSRPRNRLLSALLLLSIVAIPCLASGQQKADATTQAPKVDLSNFSYTSQDRRDPFEPVYLLKKKREKTNDVKKTGYELEELKLVGILKTGNVKFGMMEDLQGRGLLFKKGDFLNKNLWVLDILEDKMLLGYKLRGDLRKMAIDIPRK